MIGRSKRGAGCYQPTSVLGTNGNAAQSVYVEAAATDMLFEGEVKATAVTVLMNSDESDRAFAPYTMTTESSATGQQSGKIEADMLVVTMGNDIPTPLSGGSLENRVNLRTAVDSKSDGCRVSKEPSRCISI